MAMSPFDDPFFNRDRWGWPMRSRILDQNFGTGLFNEPFFRSPFMYPGFFSGALGEQRTGFSDVTNDKDKFVVKMDVTHFKPEEIKVKTVDNVLVVEAQHEEKKDEHGLIKRAFTRRYSLPAGTDVANTQSTLSADGILTIHAPKLPLPAPAEHQIPIQQSTQQQSLPPTPTPTPKTPKKN